MNYNNFRDINYLKKLHALQISEKDNRGGRTLENVKKHVYWLKKSFLHNRRKLKILDLGCGIGHYTRELALLGYDCTGIDISQFNIDYAKNMTPKNIKPKFVCGDILTYQFEVNYDLILFPYSIFNLFKKKNGLTLLKKIFNALNNDGLFYFEVIDIEKHKNSHHYVAGSGDPENFYCDQQHIFLLNRKYKKNKVLDEYFIINKDTFNVLFHKGELYIYSENDISNLLSVVGFRNIRFHSIPPGVDQDIDIKYYIITATKNSY